jgi:hypothetical protein
VKLRTPQLLNDEEEEEEKEEEAQLSCDWGI